ncbi:hypothetical protein [Mariniflexile aquimaris]|uniref:hypothetical protein n=1 Tax=Mariniflexile aquimaris TaxID=881009 RepID=UPI0036D22972
MSELNNNFTTEQISDLKKITDFFKNQMCLNTNSDFKKCYKQIPHEYLEATGNGFWANINFEKQKELYDQISESTFNEIWLFCKSTEYKTGLETKSLCPNLVGKYQKYLSDIGNSNPRIAKYVEKINMSGDFYPMSIKSWYILNDKKNFDLEDPNIQLILIIHYLSLNDQEKRNEKWMVE